MSPTTVFSKWHSPSADVRIRPGEIDVWRARLDTEPEELARIKATLSADERARASAFHFARDQRRFIAARGILRDILARYLQQDSQDIQFSYGPAGKPSLALPSDANGLRFNLSHADELTLVAVTAGAEIGVDAERVRAALDGRSVGEFFFSPSELATLEALPCDKQVYGFYTIWTAKEAYLKARGDGLMGNFTRPADDFVSEILRTNEASGWSVYRLQPQRGYVAALVVRGTGQKIMLWNWDGGQRERACIRRSRSASPSSARHTALQFS